MIKKHWWLVVYANGKGDVGNYYIAEETKVITKHRLDTLCAMLGDREGYPWLNAVITSVSYLGHMTEKTLEKGC